MSLRYASPYPDSAEAWVDVPERWLGKHAVRYEEARGKLKVNWPFVFQKFALSLALLDDWSIPGLTGKPENWDFLDFDLRVMGWVNQVAYESYNACWNVPKNGLRPLRNGQVTALTNAPPPGTLEMTLTP